MRTAPEGAAAVLFADRPDVLAALSLCGTRVGDRVEVDLDRAADVLDPADITALEEYSRKAEQLWAHAAAGGAMLPHLVVHRRMAEHVQVTSKKGRADLVEVYQALVEATPALAEVTSELTGPAPDPDLLAQLVEPLEGQVRHGDGQVEVEVTFEGAHTLPRLLGGTPLPGEVSRTLRLTARQAAWRDRRVRRLAGVQVLNEEVWPARPLTGAPA
jgi:hypothetical protein